LDKELIERSLTARIRERTETKLSKADLSKQTIQITGQKLTQNQTIDRLAVLVRTQFAAVRTSRARERQVRTWRIVETAAVKIDHGRGMTQSHTCGVPGPANVQPASC